jgi:hypothetical protein
MKTSLTVSLPVFYSGSPPSSPSGRLLKICSCMVMILPDSYGLPDAYGLPDVCHQPRLQEGGRNSQLHCKMMWWWCDVMMFIKKKQMLPTVRNKPQLPLYLWSNSSVPSYFSSYLQLPFPPVGLIRSPPPPTGGGGGGRVHLQLEITLSC